MACLTLLRQAEAAGLLTFLDGDALVIRGPRRSGPVARQLIAAKAEIVAELRLRERRSNHRTFRDWTADESALVGWFAANRDRIPAAPFKLAPGRVVTDRDRFLAALDRDLAAGPCGCRAVGLVADLLALRSTLSINPVSEAA